MKLLAAPSPIIDPDLGIESLGSFLHRLARVYNASAHQMLRYLCESSEVSTLVGQKPYRSTRPSGEGYSSSVKALVYRIQAATGLANVSAMTLLRVAPALTPRGHRAFSPSRRSCPECTKEFNKTFGKDVFEPLLWAMATVTFCPIHRVPLRALAHRQPTSPIEAWLADRQLNAKWSSYEQWRLNETIALLSFCSEAKATEVTADAVRLFLTQYMELRGLAIADFAQLTSFPYGNLKRHIEGINAFTLTTVFAVGQRLAISPVSILSDPREAAKSTSLFDIRNHASCEDASAPRISHAHHSSSLPDILRARIINLLSRDDPLPPLISICLALNVSTGYARHHLGSEVAMYLKRRRSEARKARIARLREATKEVRRVIKTNGTITSIKRTEKAIRSRTHLPKHLLLQELKRALRTRHRS